MKPKAIMTRQMKWLNPFNNPDLNWRIVAGTGRIQRAKGDYEKAVELNDSALKILDGMRNTLQTNEQKTSFMASERYVYEDIIDLLGHAS